MGPELPPRMAMLHCSTPSVAKAAYKDQAYTDLLKVAFTSKHKCIEVIFRGAM